MEETMSYKNGNHKLQNNYEATLTMLKPLQKRLQKKP